MKIQLLVLFLASVGVKSQDPEWHMVVGGWNDQASSLSTVELLNWKTGDHCIMSPELPKDISAHVGSIMSDGSPLVCGGLSDFVPQSKCYFFDKSRESWFEHSELIEDTYFGGMVLVPMTERMFIFGGNSLTYSQQFSVLSGLWNRGPDLNNLENVIGQCVVQLNSYTTAFLGGSNNAFGIVTLDWTKMEYTFAAELHRPRANSPCTTAINEFGDTVVVIAGGGLKGSKGLEIWNPRNNTVTLEVDILPQEIANDSNLQNAFLIAINGGKELLISGGYDGATTQKSIWKYSLLDKTWTEFGQLFTPRNDHVVLPIDGVTC